MRLALVILLGGLMPAGGALAELAGDRDAGKRISMQCRTCHGADGYAQIPIAPHIGGEPESYLRHQLTAFRDGTREHEMMSIVAKGLSDQQIADLSAWYAGHEVRVEMVADASEAPQACVACHGADGLHLMDDVPNLAGETNIYIDTQLKAFRTGKRTHEIMSVVAADLTDQEIRAYADWYAAVKLYIDAVD
ncbi:MAG: cytochrome c [Roseobacter sp.]